MEPARKARVAEPEKAVADVNRKTHRLDRKTRVVEDPAAEAARVAARAAVKAPVEAGESDLKQS